MTVKYTNPPEQWLENHRECLTCHVVKPFSAFSKHKQSFMGHASTCKQCRRGKYIPHPTPDKKIEWRDGYRPCSVCGEILSLEKFGPLSHGPFGKNTGCKPCRSKENRLFRKAFTPEYKLWEAARGRAKKYNRDFTITVEDIKIPKICPVFNEPMIRGGKYAPSIDRIDSDKGYTPDNIQIISRRANFLKCNATFEEIELLYRFSISQR